VDSALICCWNQQCRLLFELMVLESAQADMSWSSILALRNDFRFVWVSLASLPWLRSLLTFADFCYACSYLNPLAVDNFCAVLDIQILIKQYRCLTKWEDSSFRDTMFVSCHTLKLLFLVNFCAGLHLWVLIQQ
jgi:hypothetical protein